MDQLLRGIVKNRAIRVYFVNSTETSRQICILNHTTPVVSDALSRLVSVGAMMAGMLKDGRLSLKISSNGPIQKMIVDASYNGQVRGFVINPYVELPLNRRGQLDVGKAVGDLGVLTVTKRIGLKQDFIGDVILVDGEIGTDFCYYFQKSEQTPSSVIVGAQINTNYEVGLAGGVIIQLLPSAPEEDIVYAEELTKKIPSIVKLLEQEPDIRKVAENLIPDLDVLAVTPVTYHCDCSKERFISGIATLPADEIEDIIKEDHGCEIRCEFCGKVYNLDEHDLAEALKIRKEREPK